MKDREWINILNYEKKCRAGACSRRENPSILRRKQENINVLPEECKQAFFFSRPALQQSTQSTYSKKIILASASPRRKKLLSKAGINFEIFITNADEDISEPLPPHEFAMEVALRKAVSAASILISSKKPPDNIILSADTIVVIDGQVLGKPKDYNEAFSFLRLLSGRTHEVYTGFVIAVPHQNEYSFNNYFCKTDVIFNNLSDEQIDFYINTNEPFDKAGGYGAQNYTDLLIDRIDGDYDNVVGLPVCMVLEKLRLF